MQTIHHSKWREMTSVSGTSPTTWEHLKHKRSLLLFLPSSSPANLIHSAPLASFLLCTKVKHGTSDYSVIYHPCFFFSPCCNTDREITRVRVISIHAACISWQLLALGLGKTALSKTLNVTSQNLQQLLGKFSWETLTLTEVPFHESAYSPFGSRGASKMEEQVNVRPASVQRRSQRNRFSKSNGDFSSRARRDIRGIKLTVNRKGWQRQEYVCENVYVKRLECRGFGFWERPHFLLSHFTRSA